VARKNAFTLIELLVVLAIVAILVAILFPVFNKARAQAKASVCQSNFKQVLMSSLLYITDYDDRYALSRYTHRLDATSANDKTWVQLILPYGHDFRIYKCPSDFTRSALSEAVFDEDLVPGDTYTRYYRASKRTNVGYNYLYLSPLIQTSVFVSPLSRSQTDIADQTNMIMYGDSAYRVTQSGQPDGGGTYLIVPPCRYANDDGGLYDTFRLPDVPSSALYVGDQGWQPIPDPGDDDIPVPSGGLYPWHSNRLTVAFVDGHAGRVALNRAPDGCDVKSAWMGYIHNRQLYLWDMD
jgi:prepilin-type N-terminal cleavage/methylation domain-containing protein/prepilin-type processing-associated H-X9-DG protein